MFMFIYTRKIMKRLLLDGQPHEVCHETVAIYSYLSGIKTTQ